VSKEYKSIPSIQSLIDLELQPKPRERSGKYNPSSFGYCYRNQFWNRKDEPQSNPPDERSLRVFQAGNLFHDFVQNIIRKQDENNGIEVAIENEDFKGRADLVIGNEVMDIKSQHSRSFWWMEKKEFDIIKDKFGNWLQVMYYALELDKEFGRLVFISKDDLCIKEFIQPLNTFWKKHLSTEITTLKNIWKADKLPPAAPRCEYKFNKKNKEVKYWQCDYCNWRDLCQSIEKDNWPETKTLKSLTKK
jgi:hypothetical protein